MKVRQLGLLILLVFAIPVFSVAEGPRYTVVRADPFFPQEHSDPPDMQTTRTETEFDDVDSHKWIAEPDWGDAITVDHVHFDDRDVLRARIDSPVKNWALMRTDAFPLENWRDKTGLKADVYQEGGVSGTALKLEVRGAGFDSQIAAGPVSIYCRNLQRNAWKTCTWGFPTDEVFGSVAHLSIVFDYLGGTRSTFYVDNLRLVSASGEDEWDDMDDGSREWFYFGNWYNWFRRSPFGPEPISHNGNNPQTPAGSAYLQWDYMNGDYYPLTAAEIGTSQLHDLSDWSGYNRLTADIKVSDPNVPISVFLWDAEGATTPTDCRGFGSPAKRVQASDTWQTVTWDLPWPSCFNSKHIDELKVVANGIDQYRTGTLYLDNITLVSDALPSPVTGLIYVLENFDDRSESFNDFSGNWGLLNGGLISTTFDNSIYRGTWGSSLRIEYDLPRESFTGLWQSLWGHSDYTETQRLDFTDVYGDLNQDEKDFEQITFWVRGSGVTTGTHNLKVELKDASGDYHRTAYRYITIDDGDTTWRQIVLDADVTNAAFWSYNSFAPDPTKMKQIVFVIESYFNNPTGLFYIDDIHFVDADDSPFDIEQHADDEFLDLVSQKTFLYFLDWRDPNTGLVQDRSTFPDLMSTAATGFGLTALAIGESRGWIERPLAVGMITQTLHTLHNGQSPTDTVTDTITGTNGYKGFFYHFLGNNGLRKDSGSELSSIDTALLVAGILTVREHFDDVPEIVDLADRIYQRIDWPWMLDSRNNQFHMAWKPEQDPHYGMPTPGGGYYSNYYWDYTTDETILIDLLAIGSPTHPVPKEVFYAWARNTGAYGGHSLVHSYNGSFFTYVFAHLWVDFRALGQDSHPTRPVDWWANSVEAAWASWQFAVDHQDDTPGDRDDNYTTYGEKSWGLTAADGPDKENPYHAYGALPVDPGTTADHDGTIAPYGAGMATMLLPEKAIPALKHYFGQTDLWRYRFGFGDAYNLDPPDGGDPWYNHAAFGIDQGPMLISIENYRSKLIWNTYKRNSAASSAICSVWPCTFYLPLVSRLSGHP